MIPTPVPDHDVAPGTARHTFVAPSGDLLDDDIRPCEGLVFRDPSTQLPAVQVRLVLEDGELAALQAGEPVWLTMLGNLLPFDIRVGDARPTAL